MNAFRLCFSVDDVGYDGFSTEAHFARLLDFLAEQKVKTTFMVVPRSNGTPISERPGYVQLLRRARAEGHELAQHGLDHDRFEFGIPPKMVLDLPHEGPAREHITKHWPEIDAALTVPSLRARLREGRRILEAATGTPVNGFRGPCLSICDNLFTAIEAEGYRWDSSRHFQDAGWDILNGVSPIVPRPITRAKFDALQMKTVREFPLTTDYAWYLKRARYAVTWDLARHDCDACLAAGIPFLPICHVSPIAESENGCGYEMFRALFAYAREQAQARGVAFESLTLSEACARS